MCGIAVTRQSEKRCYSMLENMKHRGLPGTANVVQCGPWFLGHNRLPIIGLETLQNQPITNDFMTMVFNGEIYNYKELVPTAQNDTEALLHILTYDIDLMDKVDGMYAAVCYDHINDQLHVITDHLSKKPLYINHSLEIASEIKGFIPIPEHYTVNNKYLATVAHFGYSPNCNDTIFNQIIQIEPNSHIIIDIDGEIISENELLDMTPNYMNPHMLYGVIYKATINRLVSDVPVSLLLSGGLDSSIIAKILSSKIPHGLDCLTISNSDDLWYAQTMSNRIMGNLTLVNIPEDYDLQKIMYHNETPIDLGSVVPQYLLCQEVAKSGKRVIITGDGADELFGGYTRMSKYIDPTADTQYHDVFSELPYYHCPRLDKMSMASTVELRSPFLSREVIRSAIGIPYNLRIGKQILKSMFYNELPIEIINRKKEPLRMSEMSKDKSKFRYDRLKAFVDKVIPLYR